MDDTLEVEVLQSVFSSHSQMAARAAAALWARLLLLLESLLVFVQLHLLQPQAAVLLLVLALLTLFINDRCFECVCAVVRQLRRWLPGRAVHDVAEALCGPTPPLEWRGRRAAAFAIQGQRASMEDRFDAEEEITLSVETEGRALSIYGVYDGHGGDFAAEFTKQHLVAAIKNKLCEVRAQRRSSSETEGDADSVGMLTLSASKAMPPTSIQTPSVSIMTPADSTATSVIQTPSVSISTSSGTVVPVSSSESSPSEDVPESSDDAAPSSAGDSLKSDCELPSAAAPSPTSGGTTSATLRPPAGHATLHSGGRSAPTLHCPEHDSVSEPQRPLRASKSQEAYLRSPRTARAAAERGAGSVHGDMLVNFLGEVNYSRLMQDVFSEVDDRLLDSARRKSCIAGTTAVVALVDGDQVVVASCGDSRAVLCDARGNAVSLSTDHKPDQLSEKKRITEAGGFVTFNGVWRVNGILATSRALGDLPFKERRLLTCRPDVQTVSVRHHAAPFLLLASDGLWDAASAQEAVQHVRARLHEPDLGARSLALLAYQRGSLDNITVVVVDLRSGQVGRTGSTRRSLPS